MICSFLVAAQETNQRKRLGDVLTAKAFVTAPQNQHLQPAFEPPSPRPPPGPRRWTEASRTMDGRNSIIFTADVDFRNFDYRKSSDQRRKGFSGEGGSKPGKQDGLCWQFR